MEFANDASGAATVRNTVISKRVGSGLPDYWSTNTAMGTDPDTGRVAAFYSSYTTSNLKLYKHVSGTDTVTDQIAGGATRNLPGGVNWGGLGADPRTGMLYGAQNGGAPVLFGMDLATGTTRTWSRGSTLTSVPANDLVFAGGTLVPDIFVDVDGGVYYGIVYSGSTYIYRLDPATGATAQAVRITGAGAGNGFNNYGMAFFDGAVYLGYYGGALYRADPRTGVPVQVAGGNAQDNQTGRISSESGGSWPITDLASCAVAPNLTSRLVVAKAADTATAKPGGTGRYTVTARNDGAVPVTGAVVTDDLGGVVDDAVYNNDATARTADGTATGTVTWSPGDRTLRWTGTVARGGVVTVTYTVRIGSPPAGNKRLTNRAVGPDRTNCPLPMGDRRRAAVDPDCATTTPIRSLALVKTATPAGAAPGEAVHYRVTVTNTGAAAYEEATFTDDLSGVLDAATWNGDARADGGTLDWSAPRLTWRGALAAGRTVTVSYSVTVRADLTGERTLRNAVTSGTPGANCEEPSGPGCGTETPVVPPVLPPTGSRAIDLLPAVAALLTLGVALTVLRRRAV
ncbi:isopeptide-forming domain-containing fimbrial protein [Kitasatospora purpeofusca]|uniref:isopeptide-forming domain-containing fimbrial protein n=1 Tax=Kitasatospora purpeofusca TaxID=67352 RepID=UPI002E0E4D16|nr:isopeptide-forming domain-containing fimbrial protein [Kitasatospora purpeofusca]